MDTLFEVAKSRCRPMLLACSALIFVSDVALAIDPAPFMMSARVDGQLLEGQPLAWNQRQMLLLGRDGTLHQFAPDAAQDTRKTGPRFASYSIREMRTRLSKEFGQSYDISTTTHFVVVHPKGAWNAWAERLESLYRSFTRYMRVRGFSTNSPQVPLVAIVFRSQPDYYRHAAEGGTKLQANTLGHYDPKSNRIFLFDANGVTGQNDWSANLETVIHEATHQTAYNVGVHRRFAAQPRWLVEGLAMMFEARGVWNARSVDTRADRLNRNRLLDFRAYAESRPKDSLLRLISTNRPFRTRIETAYAEAWALSFYLCETRPKQYCRYLAQVAKREAFSTYPAQSRVADFSAAFGRDLEMLDAQFLRYVAELR